MPEEFSGFLFSISFSANDRETDGQTDDGLTDTIQRVARSSEPDPDSTHNTPEQKRKEHTRPWHKAPLTPHNTAHNRTALHCTSQDSTLQHVHILQQIALHSHSHPNSLQNTSLDTKIPHTTPHHTTRHNTHTYLLSCKQDYHYTSHIVSIQHTTQHSTQNNMTQTTRLTFTDNYYLRSTLG